VPRNRSGRSAALGVTVRRPATTQLTPRNTGALRRRLVVGGLVLLSLVLVTISFREDGGGPLSSAQSAAATALTPAEVVVHRVSQPFRDVYGWADSLLAARSEADRLRREVELLRLRAIRNDFAVQENAYLRRLLHFQDGARFPRDFSSVAAAVIGRPAGAFTQAIVIAAGTDDGIRVNDPVVTAEGLVGLVTRVTSGTARVQLLTDQQVAVSAVDLRTGAGGIVRHSRGTRETLVLDRVRKEDVVQVADEIVTAGWQASGLSSLYPKGIPVGTVASVGQTDTDLYKQVQVVPYVDFGGLDAVLVLVRRDRAQP
jgi:rod shape-determining protein MreC